MHSPTKKATPGAENPASGSFCLQSMTIETKFEPGSTVWMMQNNKPISGWVLSIRVKVTEDPNQGRIRIEEYIVMTAIPSHPLHESILFNSREELIKSLQNG